VNGKLLAGISMATLLLALAIDLLVALSAFGE